MANNTSRGITYPTSGDSISPLETVFATLASTTNTAMGNLAATDITSGTLPIARGGTGGATAAAALAALGAVSAANYNGKNKILNSDFSIWQRASTGTTSSTTGYFADRWRYALAGGSAKGFTQSRQNFTAGFGATTFGQETKSFYRIAVSTTGGGGYTSELFEQPIEDVRTFAGQTVTLSFWASSDSARSITPRLIQNFGTSGSSSVTTAFAAQSITSAWTKFTATITLPSVSGKTISAADDHALILSFSLPLNATYTFNFWGVQLEKGSAATAFSTNGANQEEELSACQRYYYRISNPSTSTPIGLGYYFSTTVAYLTLQHPVTMRANPTTFEFAATSSFLVNALTPSAITGADGSPSACRVSLTTTAVTAGIAAGVRFQGTANAGYIGVGAEL
jgi:hypothetical protein